MAQFVSQNVEGSHGPQFPSGIRDRRARLFLLTGVFLLSLLLRWWPGPDIQFVHPDEPIVVYVVDHMQASHSWDTNDGHSQVPLDFRYDQYNFSGYHVISRIYIECVQRLGAGADWNPAKALKWYRILSLLFGSLAAVLAAAVAYRYGGFWAGLLAGVLAAGHPQLVQDGHYARADAFLTFLTLLCAWLALRREESSWSDVLMTAFLAGFAVSVKITAAALVIFTFLAGYRAAKRYPLRLKVGLYGSTLPLFVCGAFLGMPGAFTHRDAYLHGLNRLYSQYSVSNLGESAWDPGPIWGNLAAYYFLTLWPVTLILLALGIYKLVREKQWRLATGLLLPAGLTYLYFGRMHVFFERNLSHVLPLTFIVCGLGLAYLLSLKPLEIKNRRWTVGITLLLLSAGRSLAISAVFVAQDLPGDFKAREAEADALVSKKFPNSYIYSNSLLDAPDSWWKEVGKKLSQSPVIFKISDFKDPRTERNLEAMRGRYSVEELLTLPSPYSSLPYCTLLVYHARTIRYFRLERPLK